MESENVNDPFKEQLQQRAAALYLRGQFAEALGVWHEMLGVDADDERAREGVRLCEILTRRQVTPAHRLRPAPEAAAPPPPPAAPEGQAAAAPPGALPNVPSPEEIESEMGKIDDFFDNLAASPAPEGVGATPPAPEAAAPTMPPAMEAPPPAGDPSQTMAIDLGSLDLSGLGDLPEMPEAPAMPEAQGMPETEATDALALGMPLTEEDDPTPLGLATRAPLGIDQPPAEAESPEASVERAAQAELRRRVHQLVAEAEAAETAGDVEQAERLLQRVLILDEHEARAASMLRRLRGEPEPISQPMAAAPTSTPEREALDGDFPSYDATPGFESTSQVPADGLGEDLLGAVPGGDLLGAVPTPPLADAGAPGAVSPSPAQASSGDLSPDLPEGRDDDELSDAEKLDALERAAARLARYHAEQNSVVSAKRVLPVVGFGVGGLLLLGAIGWGVISLTGGSGEEADGQQANMGPQLAKKNKQNKDGATAVVEPEAPEADPGQLQAWVDQAFAAHEAGQYADALELYDRVLEIDPEHPGAKAGVAVTIDVYQRQQQLSRKEREAYDAFERGDFRTALRAFYRLPDETGGDYTREIANGWYNLALISLNGAECDSAEGFLSEVGDLVETDPSFQKLWELAVACNEGAGTAWFAEQLSRLRTRAAHD